jgi:peptide/nickel transport system permease protein
VLLLVALGAAAPLVVKAVGVTGPGVRHPGAVTLGQPSGPSTAHPFGVDELGRDVLARVVYGTRTALFDGIVGALIAGLAGGLLGLAAARLGGWARASVRVVADAFTAFPVVLLGLAVGASCDAGGCAAGAISPGIATVVFVVALCGFGPVARAAARGPSWRSPAGVALRFVPVAILLDTALGFLGAGVRGSTADWGQMLAGAEHAIVSGESAWWLLLFPGVALLITVIAWRVLASAVRERTASAAGPGVVGVLAPLPLIAGIAFVLFSVLPERSGASMFHHSPLGAIGSHLAGTVSVLAGPVVLWLVLGPVLTVAATRRRGRPLRAVAFVLASAPVFVLGTLAVWLFASDVGKLAVLPGVGRYVGLTADPGKWLGSLALPWISLGLWWTACGVIAARSDAARVLDAGFVRLARAKGLSAGRVFWRHVVRAMASACAGRLARDVGVLLGGVLLTEVVFKLGGVGLLAYDAARLGAVATAQWVAVLAAALVMVVRALRWGIRR